MKKYFQIFKISFKDNKVSFVNTLLTMFSFTIIIFIFFNLWTYVFSNNAYTLQGYSFKQLMWYFIMGEVIAFTLSGKYLIIGMNEDIKSGKISYILNKPYNYYFYTVVNNLGEVFFKFIFIGTVSMVIGILLLGVQGLSFAMILPILLCYFLTCVLSSLFYALVGLISFWTEDAQPFYWLFSKIFLIFGVFFPPEFFPSAIRPIIKYSPIYSMYSGVSKLIAKFSWDLFFEVVTSQVIYIILFTFLGLLIYRIGTRKVNINGG